MVQKGHFKQKLLIWPQIPFRESRKETYVNVAGSSLLESGNILFCENIIPNVQSDQC